MGEREWILAKFQAHTGKDHIKEFIAILEQYNWNQAEHLVRGLQEDHW